MAKKSKGQTNKQTNKQTTVHTIKHKKTEAIFTSV